MTKKKSKSPEVAMEEPKQSVSLYGKDVIKDVKIDQKVKLYITGKVVEISRQEYNDNKLHQRIEIDTIKKVMSSSDLDDAAAKRANNA